MRTLSVNKRLLFILNQLKLWIIGGKKWLTTRQAALYLHTDVPTICLLTQRYDLPYYQTYRHTLYFKRSEIDAWLKPRPRRKLCASLKECTSHSAVRARRTVSTLFPPPQQTSLEEHWHAGSGAIRGTNLYEG